MPFALNAYSCIFAHMMHVSTSEKKAVQIHWLLLELAHLCLMACSPNFEKGGGLNVPRENLKLAN